MRFSLKRALLFMTITSAWCWFMVWLHGKIVAAHPTMDHTLGAWIVAALFITYAIPATYLFVRTPA